MRLSVLYFLFCFVLLMSSFACTSEQSEKEPVEKETEVGNSNTTSETDTVSAGFFDTYENTRRYIWQKPEMVISLISDLQGNIEDKTIADIGAGKGFFALRLAKIAKKVIAIEISDKLIEELENKKSLELPEEYQDRLETRLALPNDAKLQSKEADVVLIVNTFTYIKDKLKYLKKLRKGIAGNGKIIIIDFKKKRLPFGPPQDIKVPLFSAEDILAKAGYENIQSNDTALDYQYIVMADSN